MSVRRVVIVEPNPGILIVGRNVLARAGFAVAAASTTEEGLQEARRISPDVILLDGRVSEPEVLVAFARVKPHGVPIILTVQKGRDVLTIEALEAGGWSDLVEVADVIEKPFAPERLLQAVEKALQRSAERTDPRLVITPDLAAAAEEDPWSERTDTYERTAPFEALLESVAERAPTRPPSASVKRTDPPPRQASITRELRPQSLMYMRLRTKLEAALTEQRVSLEPRQILALAEACEAALEADSTFDQTINMTRVHRHGDLAIEGNLEHLSIDSILQIATSVAQPSCCRLEQDEQAVEIWFRGPNVVFARQDNMPEGFTIGRLLVASGLAEQQEVDRAVANSAPSGWLGQRLIARGIIVERDLRTALRRQIEELVFEAVRWTRGRFRVYAKDELPPEGEEAAVVIPVHHLLLEGMRRLDEWRRMVRDVGDLRAVLDRLDPDSSEIIESLKPDERALLEQVDGRRTVGDIVRFVHRPTFDVFKTLERLRGRRLVTIVEPISAAP